MSADTWFGTELPDCEYVCEGCGRLICMDRDPSPGESARICADCVDVHGPFGDCACCEVYR